VRAAVELINNFEDPLPQLLWRGVRCEQHPYSEMSLSAQFLRDQRIGGFLNTVVQEPVRIFRAEDEARSDRFPKLAVHVLLRVLVDHHQRGELRAVAQTGKLP
jgi:hypothetical protein